MPNSSARSRTLASMHAEALAVLFRGDPRFARAQALDEPGELLESLRVRAHAPARANGGQRRLANPWACYWQK